MPKWEYGGFGGATVLKLGDLRLWLIPSGGICKARLDLRQAHLISDATIKEWELKTQTVESRQREAIILFQLWALDLLEKSVSVR